MFYFTIQLFEDNIYFNYLFIPSKNQVGVVQAAKQIGGASHVVQKPSHDIHDSRIFDSDFGKQQFFYF
jgi:hypothetical protein